METPIGEGVYVGEAHHQGQNLGKAIVTVTPEQPAIAEVYITYFDGDLYGEHLKVTGLQQLSRSRLMHIYNQAVV